MTAGFDSLYQTTLARPIHCEGIGLHSGSIVTLRLYPAPADTGILFKRTDVNEAVSLVPAHYNLVTDTMLGTTITNQHGVSVATVEHLMAALWGLGVDNAIIEIDAPEIPIMDGSSEPFVEHIEQAGVVRQSAPRVIIEVLEKITVAQGASVLTIEPAKDFSMDISIDFPNAVIAHQAGHYDFSKTSFKKALCRARTFGFEKDVSKMRAAGLALGGSLDNAVVVGENGVLNKEGLRYQDEFVRHKALDLAGDLFLGGRLRGRVSGSRPGHGINNLLLRTLFADASAWRISRHTAMARTLHTTSCNVVEAAYI